MRKLLLAIIDGLFPAKTEERPSAKIRITPQLADDIIKFVKTLPGMADCYVAALKPSNSMEPAIDDGMYMVMQPVPHTDLIEGDIIWYVSPTYKAIHRIIEIGEDDIGWYALTKGDNNGRPDGVKVRPEYINGTWRATLN